MLSIITASAVMLGANYVPAYLGGTMAYAEDILVVPEEETFLGTYEGCGEVDSWLDTAISAQSLQNAEFDSAYYDQLSSTGKSIYNNMLDVYGETFSAEDIVVGSKTFNVPIAVSGGSITITDETAPQSWVSEIVEDADSAFLALIYDKPELSWIVGVPMEFSSQQHSFSASSTATSADVTYSVTFNLSSAFSDGTAIDISLVGEKDDIDAAVTSAKTEIGTYNSTVDQAKAIHDYLAGQLYYNHDAASSDTKYDENQLRAYQTAYSAFYNVNGDNYNGSSIKSTVCAGYAKGFKVLCDAYGIPCVLVSGLGGTGSSKEAHMWNYIKIDGVWYAVDCTWDDQTPAFSSSGILYDFFAAGSETQAPNFGDGVTFGSSHAPSGKWSNDSSVVFSYPALSENAYTGGIYSGWSANIRQNGTTVSWDEYPDATGYEVLINGMSVGWQTETSINGEQAIQIYDAISNGTASNLTAFTIRAILDGGKKYVSDLFIYSGYDKTPTLEAPTDYVIIGDDLVWQGNAAKYKVIVYMADDLTNIRANWPLEHNKLPNWMSWLDGWNESGKYSTYVYAYDDDGNYSAAAHLDVDYIKAGSWDANLRMDDTGAISWDPMDDDGELDNYIMYANNWSVGNVYNTYPTLSVNPAFMLTRYSMAMPDNEWVPGGDSISVDVRAYTSDNKLIGRSEKFNYSFNFQGVGASDISLDNIAINYTDDLETIYWVGTEGIGNYLIEVTDGTNTYFSLFDSNREYFDLAMYKAQWRPESYDPSIVYQVRVYGFDKEQKLTAPTRFFNIGKITTPRDVNVEPGFRSAYVSWSDVENAEYYVIYTYDSTNGYIERGRTSDSGFNVTGLSTGVNYGFLIRAYIDGEFGDFSEIKYASPVGLGKPANVNAVPGTMRVTLTWDKVDGADYYIVYTYDSVSGFAEKGRPAGEEFTVSGLLVGVNYGFVIRACSGADIGGMSDVVYAAPTGTEAPANVKAEPGAGSVTLRWDEVDGAEYYIVYTYDEVTGFAEKGRPTAAELTISGLVNNKTYGFLIRAYGNGTVSDFSAIAYATPNGISAPANVKAEPGAGSVTLRWDEADGAEYYIVYTYDEVTGFAEKGRPTKAELTISGLVNNKTYGFLIRAYGNGTVSDFSNIVYGAPNGINKPENVKAVSENAGELVITWDEVDGAEYYIVYTYDPKLGFAEKGRPVASGLTVTGLASGANYGILIRAYGLNTLSDFSDIVYEAVK